MATTAERLAALEAEVANLREEMGPQPTKVSPYPFPYPQDIYDVHGRVDQIGKGVDDAVNKINSAVAKVDVFIANPPVSAPPPSAQLPPPGAITLTDSKGLVCMLFISGNDNGLRFNYNYKEPADANGTHALPNLPQVLMGVEEEGAWFVAGFKARVTAPSQWERGGKTFKLYPLGYGGDGLTTEFVSIVSSMPGRGVEICVSDAPDNNASMYRPKLQIKGDGSANPVSMFVGGKMREVTIDFDGTMRAL